MRRFQPLVIVLGLLACRPDGDASSSSGGPSGVGTPYVDAPVPDIPQAMPLTRSSVSSLDSLLESIEKKARVLAYTTPEDCSGMDPAVRGFVGSLALSLDTLYSVAGIFSSPPQEMPSQYFNDWFEVGRELAAIFPEAAVMVAEVGSVPISEPVISGSGQSSLEHVVRARAALRRAVLYLGGS